MSLTNETQKTRKSLDSNISSLIQALGPDAWRLTPATFASHLSKGRWKAATHLRYASAIIARELQKGSARIIVSMPPRHGKSELVSHHTLIWALDRWPTWPCILCSYGADLAEHFVKRVRDEIDSQNADGIQLRCHLSKDLRRSDRFATKEGGGVIAAGVAGPITGRGAKLLIIDDYLKNAKDASSDQIRQDQWDWLISTALPRLEPEGSVIICATRWNRDDIIGRLLDKEHRDNSDESLAYIKPWLYIELPALAYENDPLGREQGAVLWEERYPMGRLKEISAEMGGDSSFFWMALFQQRPIPRTAGVVTQDMFQIVTSLPGDIEGFPTRWRMVRGWDLAATPEEGDYIVGTLVAEDRHTHKIYIIDVQRGRIGPKDIDQLLLFTARQDGPAVQIVIEQEPGSAGKVVIDHFTRVVLRGFSAVGEKSTGDKFIRAQPLYGALQSYNVYLLKGKWNTSFINEFMTFPDSEHDDQVDSGSLAYAKLMGPRLTGVTWGSKEQITNPRSPIIDGRTGKVIEGESYFDRAKRKAALIMGPTWRSRW